MSRRQSGGVSQIANGATVNPGEGHILAASRRHPGSLLQGSSSVTEALTGTVTGKESGMKTLVVKSLAPKILEGRDRVRARLRRFRQEEDGALLLFGLFMLFLMLVVGGFAIDVMRYERERTHLQATADRAALAAAALSQTDNPNAVVLDYFTKAGIEDLYRAPQVEQGLNFRTVRVNTESVMPTMFMRAVGVNDLRAPAVSAANETVPNVEVSLVLDISGSMRFTDSGGMMQIARLRPAANRFINRLLAGDRAQTTTISIIPYAGAVNPGRAVFDLLGGQVATVSFPSVVDGVMQTITQRRDHPDSHCLEIESSDFSSSTIPELGSFDQVPHFMKWAIHAPTMDWGWCPLEGNVALGEASSAIQYFSSNASYLTSFIDRMRLHDGTGTHYGMLWGLWLLDPANNWLVEELNELGLVHDDFADRPAAYDDDETVKAIVLMTDGNITEQVRPRYPDRTLAPLNATLPADVQLHHTRELDRQNNGSQCNGAGCSVQQSNAGTNRNRFYAACNMAKANGIVIYTIAFNTNANGRTEMQNCATSISHYFDVRGADLDNAFQAIAGSIQQLRLVE